RLPRTARVGCQRESPRPHRLDDGQAEVLLPAAVPEQRGSREQVLDEAVRRIGVDEDRRAPRRAAQAREMGAAALVGAGEMIRPPSQAARPPKTREASYERELFLDAAERADG